MMCPKGHRMTAVRTSENMGVCYVCIAEIACRAPQAILEPLEPIEPLQVFRFSYKDYGMSERPSLSSPMYCDSSEITEEQPPNGWTKIPGLGEPKW